MTASQTSISSASPQASLPLSIWRNVGGVLGAAIRSMLLAFAGVLLASAALAWFSWSVLRDWPWYAASMALLVMIEGLLVMVFLGGKGAVTAAVVRLLDELQIGRAAVQWVFAAALQVLGDRGQEAIQRVPLTRAEEVMREGVLSFIHADPEARGLRAGLRRLVQRRVGALVGKMTLAEFRHEDQAQGSIDLLKVRDHLVQQADQFILGKVKQGLRIWTLAFGGGFLLLVLLQTFGLRYALTLIGGA